MIHDLNYYYKNNHLYLNKYILWGRGHKNREVYESLTQEYGYQMTEQYLIAPNKYDTNFNIEQRSDCFIQDSVINGTDFVCQRDLSNYTFETEEDAIDFLRFYYTNPDRFYLYNYYPVYSEEIPNWSPETIIHNYLDKVDDNQLVFSSENVNQHIAHFIVSSLASDANQRAAQLENHRLQIKDIKAITPNAKIYIIAQNYNPEDYIHDSQIEYRNVEGTDKLIARNAVFSWLYESNYDYGIMSDDDSFVIPTQSAKDFYNEVEQNPSKFNQLDICYTRNMFSNPFKANEFEYRILNRRNKNWMFEGDIDNRLTWCLWKNFKKHYNIEPLCSSDEFIVDVNAFALACELTKDGYTIMNCTELQSLIMPNSALVGAELDYKAMFWSDRAIEIKYFNLNTLYCILDKNKFLIDNNQLLVYRLPRINTSLDVRQEATDRNYKKYIFNQDDGHKAELFMISHMQGVNRPNKLFCIPSYLPDDPKLRAKRESSLYNLLDDIAILFPENAVLIIGQNWNNDNKAYLNNMPNTIITEYYDEPLGKTECELAILDKCAQTNYTWFIRLDDDIDIISNQAQIMELLFNIDRHNTGFYINDYWNYSRILLAISADLISRFRTIYTEALSFKSVLDVDRYSVNKLHLECPELEFFNSMISYKESGRYVLYENVSWNPELYEQDYVTRQVVKSMYANTLVDLSQAIQTARDEWVNVDVHKYVEEDEIIYKKPFCLVNMQSIYTDYELPENIEEQA